MITLRRLVGTAVAAASLFVLPAASLAGPAEASNAPSLRSLPCTRMAMDPSLEAPLYAQDEGASPSTDGWWCQLPHATKVPGGFRQLYRSVAPLGNTYALFQTKYGVPVPGASSTTDAAIEPSVIVADNVNSTVAPPHRLAYPLTPKGRRIKLSKGITATVSTIGPSVSVTWHYPTAGVPKYLRAVATITVTGTGVPKATVIGVARHVKPA